jgi:hypothetical protein
MLPQSASFRTEEVCSIIRWARHLYDHDPARIELLSKLTEVGRAFPDERLDCFDILW